MIEWATEKGIVNGIAVDEQKKAIEIAKNRLNMGIQVPDIAKASELSEAETESLK
ncbi:MULTISPECIES: hypothetical protein [unclassified Paenibacillus]|uniref:hypothetical protein n=1 Tax=unclassified Paenibacillus TaxID=185978 RepID=UPI00020D7A83|nr:MULTISPECIES: hypothetical protein [unclassified Paenibacillus]EGL16779.1 hypothetical protein HMPREF9413_1981 [Paenibacillus sp. HGF7]